MSEEMKEELQTNETAETAEAATENTAADKPAESMADYEDHFDDSNP